MKRAFILLMLLSLFGTACAQDEDPTVEPPDDETAELSVAFADDAPETVEGNVAVLEVDVEGLDIVAADGDDSGDTGHLHFFIDKDPVEEGEVIPREAGVVHSAETTTNLYLAVGEHEITVVPGNGLHERLGDVSDTITLEVEGPAVDGSAPATLEEGEDLEVSIESEGVDIVAPDGEMSDEAGHYAVLLDPEEPPEAGAKMPMEEGKYVHTPEDSVTFEDLEKGEHVVWVVLVDGQHMAFDPPVMDRIAVTVS